MLIPTVVYDNVGGEEIWRGSMYHPPTKGDLLYFDGKSALRVVRVGWKCTIDGLPASMMVWAGPPGPVV